MRIADRFFCSLICQQLRPLTRKRDAAASQIAFQVCFHRKIFYIRNLWKIRVKVYVRGGATFPFHRNRQNSNGLEPVWKREAFSATFPEKQVGQAVKSSWLYRIINLIRRRNQEGGAAFLPRNPLPKLVICADCLSRYLDAVALFFQRASENSLLYWHWSGRLPWKWNSGLANWDMHKKRNRLGGSSFFCISGCV